MRLLNCVVGVAALVGLLTFPVAAAIGQQSPPPNPEVDQYLPTVPGDEGDVGVGGGGGGGSNDGGSLPPGTRKELGSQGPAGESAGAFLDDPGTSSRANGGGGGATQDAGSQDAGGGVLRRSKESDGDEATSVVAATGDSQSPVSPSRDALAGDDDEGLGIVFPVLLAAIAAGGIALALKRRPAFRRG